MNPTSHQIDIPKTDPSPLSTLILRKSPIFLGFQLVILEVIATVIMLLIHVPSLLAGSTSTSSLVLDVSIYLIVIVLLGKLGLVFWVIANWFNNYCEIHREEIVLHRGVFRKTRRIYSTENMRTISVDQTLFGEIFRHGTILIQAMSERLELTNVANPKKHAEAILELLPNVELIEHPLSDPF